MLKLLLIGGFALATAPAMAGGFTLSSPDFRDGSTIPDAQVFNGFGCTGGNQSPALAWSGAPAGTESFAVTMFDPDAPTGAGWWHWTVFNIPATTSGLVRNAGTSDSPALPAGAVQGRNDFGFSYYGGPCPPVGDPPHHYRVTVYALKVAKLPLDASAPGSLVGYYLNSNTLASASITGTYGRPKS